MSLSPSFSTTHDDGIPIKKLYISNLPKKITSKDLKKIFSTYGEVRCSYIITNNHSRPYRFVTFTHQNDALKVRIAANEKRIIYKGRALRVMPTTSDMQPDSIIYRKRMLKRLKPTLNVLDNDCLMKIFSYLPIPDRIRIERVCKRWRVLNPHCWNNIKDLKIPVDPFYLSSESFMESTCDFSQVLMRCGRFLTSLEIKSCFQHSEENLIEIAARHCHNLTYLIVKSFRNHYYDLTQLFRKNKKLEHLEIYYCHSTEFDVALKNLPINSMKKITLHTPTMYRYDQDQKDLGMESVMSIQNMAKLQKLELGGFRLKKKTLKLIVDNDTITDLGFPMCSFKNCISLILNLHGLEHLDLQNVSEVDNNFLIKLATNCPGLRSLNISNCQYITSEGISAIAKLTNLQILKTKNTDITDSNDNDEDNGDEFDGNDYGDYYDYYEDDFSDSSDSADDDDVTSASANTSDSDYYDLTFFW